MEWQIPIWRGNKLYGWQNNVSEEVGELARAMRKELKAQNSSEIIGTVDEELYDIIYYALAIANIYDIDIEKVAKVKSEMTEIRYPSDVKFEEGR